MIEDQTNPLCQTYTLNSLRHVDCSYRDLTELPDGLDYEVSLGVLHISIATFFTYRHIYKIKLKRYFLNVCMDICRGVTPIRLGQLC